MKVSDEKLKAQQEAAVKLRSLKETIAAEERRAQELRDVAADVQRQLRSAGAALEDMKARYPTLLNAEVWNLLRLRVPDEALPKLTQLEETARERVANLRKHGTPDQTANGLNREPASGETITPKGISALIAENDSLTKELGLDQAKLKRRADLEKRLAAAKQHEERTKKQLTHAEKAPERRRTVQIERLASYEKVFRALVTEEEAFEKLYRPLRGRIAADPRLSKLSFVVHRVVDIEGWVTRGEALLDLRRPPFKGKDALADTVRRELLGAWQSGTPEDARKAMERFMEEHASAAFEIMAQGATPVDFGEWLFSTDHIAVRYGIQYEGVEIAHLSPGTRGVVLLTLYLGLDDWDQRPLIIDQPEENLDPRSVYDDLVPFFRDAAKRRQLIMVTHNANLVVNTDSDQVIVAEAERESPIKLPKIRYVAGGLEDPEIRAHVCSLLEGRRGSVQEKRAAIWHGVTLRPSQPRDSLSDELTRADNLAGFNGFSHCRHIHG